MPDDLQDVFSAPSPSRERLRELLCEYRWPWSAPDVQILPVASGLSGGHIWKVVSGTQAAALRRWPRGYPPRRLLSIHSVLLAQWDAGCRFIPRPIGDSNGKTIRSDESLWDLTTWMPGEPAEADQATDSMIRSVLRGLRQWHDLGRQCAAHVDVRPLGDHQTVQAFLDRRPARSPGLVRRKAEWMRRSPLSPVAPDFPDPSELSRRTLEAAKRSQAWWQALDWEADKAFSLTLCWNDPQRENVLFAGKELSGLVDYGSLAIDCAAADLARFLGSVVPDCQRWIDLLSAYDAVEHAERWAQLAGVYFYTGTVVAALHWWEWHVQKRTFADPKAAYRRWRTIVETLEALLPPQTYFSR